MRDGCWLPRGRGTDSRCRVLAAALFMVFPVILLACGSPLACTVVDEINHNGDVRTGTVSGSVGELTVA